MAYKRLDPEDFVVSADSITAPAWTNNTPTLTTFFTSSIQEGSPSGQYYLNVYNLAVSNANTEIQFNIAYGNKYGSGSLLYQTGINGLSPTRTVFGQFRNLIYGDENTDFSFNGVTPVYQDFFAITLERARYKQSLFPGSLSLTLKNGSNTVYLTDNSNDVTVDSFLDCGRVYQIVSGSNGSAIGASSTPAGAVANGMTVSGSYGLFLPDIGTIILNKSALNLSIANGGTNLNYFPASNTNDKAPGKLFTQISASANFALNSQETITSDFVFCRARNGEFNYTENPSFISGSTGLVLYDTFIQNPQTYITSIGMYNDNNELLAVAKLSKPLKKDFTKETLVRVKLDF
jgi:hypothetical protein